jgi:hypothetical protein
LASLQYTNKVICPRCGHNAGGSSICSACDFVIDPSFLGSDFLDESTSAELGFVDPGDVVTMPVPILRDAAMSPFGPDPMLLGDPTSEINQWFADKSDGFLTAKTSDGLRQVLPTAFYIGGDVQQCLAPEAVLARVPEAEERPQRMSPFELVVWRQIDGQRPVARIEALMGLDQSDVHMALALLVDKRMVHRIGTAAATSTDAFNDQTMAEPVDGLPPTPVGTPPKSEPFGEPSPFSEAGAMYLRLPTGVVDLPTGAISILPPPASPPVVVGTTTMRVTTTAAGTETHRPPSMELAVERVSMPLPGRQEDALRASSLFEHCLSDLDSGNIARAYNFLRMAVDADGTNSMYREAMLGWDALVSSRKCAPDQNSWFAEALQAEQEGRYDKAIELLRLAADRTPNSAALWNRLGVLLATRRKDISGALDALGKAIELEPNNPAYMNNFGKIAALSERPVAGNAKPSGRLARFFGKE